MWGDKEEMRGAWRFTERKDTLPSTATAQHIGPGEGNHDVTATPIVSRTYVQKRSLLPVETETFKNEIMGSLSAIQELPAFKH
jgi:hypothetical protein